MPPFGAARPRICAIGSTPRHARVQIAAALDAIGMKGKAYMAAVTDHLRKQGFAVGRMEAACPGGAARTEATMVGGLLLHIGAVGVTPVANRATYGGFSGSPRKSLDVLHLFARGARKRLINR